MKKLIHLLILSMIALTNNSPLAAEKDSQRKLEINEPCGHTEIVDYVNGLNRIVISAKGLNRENYYSYRTIEGEPLIRKDFQDFKFRLSNMKMRQIFFLNELDIEKEFKEELESHLPHSLLQKFQLESERAIRHSINYFDLCSTLIINIKIGHRRVSETQEEKNWLGAISVNLNEHHNAFKGLNKYEFYPEPFLLRPNPMEQRDFQVANTFMAIQVSEYLKHLLDSNRKD